MFMCHAATTAELQLLIFIEVVPTVVMICVSLAAGNYVMGGYEAVMKKWLWNMLTEGSTICMD